LARVRRAYPSLALLADLGHLLTDAGALAAALVAPALAARPPSARRMYGLAGVGRGAGRRIERDRVDLRRGLGRLRRHLRLFEPAEVPGLPRLVGGREVADVGPSRIVRCGSTDHQQASSHVAMINVAPRAAHEYEPERIMPVTRRALAVVGLVGLVGWGEIVHWRASRALVHKRRSARSEAVVVLGYRNTRGTRANALNRWRVRAALRSIDHMVPSSVLVCSGASGAASVSEAAALARYAIGERGFTGTVRLDEQSRSTWQNVRNVIPLIEDVDQIKIVSNPLHALKARLYLQHLRPDLAERLVRAADYRPGEAWPIKPLFALYGLRDLARCRRNLAQNRG
jgi:hypothetical protein